MVALTIAAALTFSLATVRTVSAGKPAEVVEWSNGFPSGPHFNLNIHGKNPDYTCDPEPGGGSVFVPEYDSLIPDYDYSEIQIIQNKKSSISELTVHDKCAEAFDGDAIQVQLPKGHYQVYARILAKPKKDGEPREVSFHPKLVEACNDVTVYDLDGDGNVDMDDLLLLDIDGDGVIGDLEQDLNKDGFVNSVDFEIWTSTFGDLTECTDSSLIALGIVTGNGAFSQDGQSLVRTKGKSKAVNVTEMFMYSGLVFDTSLDQDGDDDLDFIDFMLTDINGDGNVDISGDALDEHNLDGLGIVDLADFEYWINMLEVDGWVVDSRTEPMWIFDIADLVVYGWDYKNNGSKLVQIRFYPDDQTEYIVE
jgi:regulator of sigma D